jgi:biofilm PGA synthesis N-glycosyltransferase PgaC
MPNNSYVIISASRNEEAYVEELIDCIAAQTIRPVRWVIVDDGSTDATYAKSVKRGEQLPFLQVAKMPGGRPRSFASQVYAAQHGAELVKDLQFEFIGFLDADIRVQPDYYEQLMARFHADPKLGLVGGAVIDQYADRVENIRKGSEDFHVAGGVQLFRREVFEKIGGYIPIQGGGQDTIADIMTLMHGWRLQVFSELPAMHLRPEGFDKDNAYRRGMKWGRKFYLIGYHPLYYFFQSVRRIFRRPFLVGGLCQLWGYLVASVRREARPVSAEFVVFLRKLQMQRLRKALFRF